MSVERADTFMAGLGVEAYRVGGSVRDEVLGRRAKDADYMVRNEPLLPLGAKIVAAGAKLSELRLRDGRQVGWRAEQRGMGLVEITLPRAELSTGPGHRDFEIVVDPSLPVAADAQRRDFTFNALYKIIAHPDGMSSLIAGPNGQVYENIIDPLGGLEDIQRRKVVITHPDSFRDDPLRTLRALRFVSTLGYDLGAETRASMYLHADAVTGLTGKGYASGTVITEMSKLLMGDNVGAALRLARDTGVLGTLFPELVPMFGHEAGSRYHDLNTDEHTFATLETAARVGAPLRVRWSLLFHDSGKPEVEWTGADGRKHYYATTYQRKCGMGYTGFRTDPDVQYHDVFETVTTEDHEVAGERRWRAAAYRLNAPARLRDDVATLIRHHMVTIAGKFKASRVRQARVQFGDDMLRDLYLHRACDVSGKMKGVGSALERLRMLEAERARAASAGVPAKVTDLEIDGKDAMAAGLEGRAIGEALREILHEVASQPNERTLSREWQLERLR